jgi:hypothetical protein
MSISGRDGRLPSVPAAKFVDVQLANADINCTTEKHAYAYVTYIFAATVGAFSSGRYGRSYVYQSLKLVNARRHR